MIILLQLQLDKANDILCNSIEDEVYEGKKVTNKFAFVVAVLSVHINFF